MNKVLLISENYIKMNSSLYDNLDPKLLRMHIFETQNINYRYLLPKDLYDDIFTQFEAYREYVNSGGTGVIADHVDARLLALVDESKPCLLYYTLYNGVYSLHSRITNKGINTQNSDYSQDTDWDVIEHMKVDWKHKAESYANLILEFLEDNVDTYPEYTSTECNNNSNKPYSSPLYLGDEI